MRFGVEGSGLQVPDDEKLSLKVFIKSSWA